jgi:parallel beta-helix repeat protein
MSRIPHCIYLIACAALPGCGGDGSSAPGPNGGPVVTPPAPPPAPAAVTDADRAAAPRQIDVQPVNAAQAIIRWADVTSDETGFLIEQQSNGAGAWTQVASVPANQTLYKQSGLSDGARYAYRVTAIRSAGSAVPSAPFAVTMPSENAPSIFFVDGASGSDNNEGSEARPWKTIQHANDKLQPGQTVLVRAGEYRRTDYSVIAEITKSGRPGAYITYKAYPGERAKLRSTVGVNYNGFEVLANYIIIDGFEIEGHNKELTLARAKAEQVAKQNGGPITPVTVSSGITFGNLEEGRQVTAHHGIARNNLVYDHPQAGINALGADYIIFENNRVQNNSRFSYFGGSGINFFQLRNLDNEANEYRNIIRNNISTGNSNEIPCLCFNFQQPTDGNGIIVDDFTATGYNGKTLIANNIVHNNGGRGIHVFQSGNVDIFNNTAYRNSTIELTGQGEITAQDASNVQVLNNIMFASDGRPANRAEQVTNVIFDYNIVFGGTSFNPSGGSRNITGTDPLFAAISGPNAFALLRGSPAVDAAIGGMAAQLFDVYFAQRPRGPRADIGAVESF